MAPHVEEQVSPHSSPPRWPAAGCGSPPSPPPQQPKNDAPEKLTPHSSPPPDSAAIVVGADSYAAQYTAPRGNARYVRPRAAEGAVDRAAIRESSGGDGRAWYPWSGRNTDPRPPPPPPPPPPQARAVEADGENRVVSNIVWRRRRAAAMQRAELAARGAGAALCLAALAVLAADHRKGWALDSYSNYSQFRYSEAVNVIGFLYSVFQLYALAELMRKKKRVIPQPEGNYFDFAMDQVLAYLLISSSSSATARVGDWIDNWGSDPFPNMANGSIVISFLAFLVFAVNSLISAYNLFCRDQ